MKCFFRDGSGTWKGKGKEQYLGGKKKGAACILIQMPDLKGCYCGFFPASLLKNELLTTTEQELRLCMLSNIKQTILLDEYKFSIVFF